MYVRPAGYPAKPAYAKLPLLVLGDDSTGKTSLMSRFINGSFSASVSFTIGVDFQVREMMIGDKVAKIQVWDTSGQPRFRSIVNGYLQKEFAGILLVYDITNEAIFTSIRSWMEQIQQHNEEHVIKVLVGNKLDLSAEHRAVSYERGKALAEEYGILFFETSAATNIRVEEVFMAVINAAMARLGEPSSSPAEEMYCNGNVVPVGVMPTSQPGEGCRCS